MDHHSEGRFPTPEILSPKQCQNPCNIASSKITQIREGICAVTKKMHFGLMP